MELERDRTADVRDVLDNPEWNDADIRARRTLADFAPELAANIARAIGRPVRGGKREDAREASEREDG